ncbi:MAG: hypothetical protein K0R65_1406 [Crocinitomicaceae bacterium]|jgi:uncharacterized repeat protein (TIGR01451 family)|nr:hypothetical protein [Crocinitomicaceae bacterium]
MKKFLLFFSFLASVSFYAQRPSVVWSKSFGGSEFDENPHLVLTSDGGYLLGGSSRSNDGDVSGNHGQNDYWVVKLDSMRNILWQKCFGGTEDENLTSIQQTTDGGYIISGTSFSNNGDVSGNHGNGSPDCWIVKLDSLGNLMWQKSLGGFYNEYASSIIQTNDGGYIFTGSADSYDGDVGSNYGYSDMWVVKLNGAGTIVWENNLGGTQNDSGREIHLTSDGGYIVAGESKSINGNVTGNHGGIDYWIVKLNASGTIVWQKSLGGSDDDFAPSLIETTEGEYIICGFSFSSDGDVSQALGHSDNWVVKLDPNGNIVWDRSFGGSSGDSGKCLNKTLDGNYIMASWSQSYDGDVSTDMSSGDIWITKIDPSGNLLWEKSIGGSESDIPTTIYTLATGGYIVSGYSWSTDFDLDTNYGGQDYCILKLNEPRISGEVYIDANQNCLRDEFEVGIGNINLIINPGNLITQTNPNGTWFLDSLPAGSYTAAIDTGTVWQATCSSMQSFDITQSVLSQGPDFGMINTNPCRDPFVSIYAPFLRRCFNGQKIYISACNRDHSTGQITSSYVEVELDPLISVNSSSLSSVNLGNNVYRFQTGNLNPGQCRNFTISTTISCDALLQQTLCMEANLFPVDPCAFDTVHSPSPNLLQCPIPWDNSHIEVEGFCQNDSVSFVITNTGTIGIGDMLCYSPVRIYVDEVLTYRDSVQIFGGSSVTYSYPGNGETWIIQVDQHPLHPGNSNPTAYVEACGNLSNWIPDLINNFELDDSDSWRDIYCGVASGSYDPNDKTGFPKGIGDSNNIMPNQQLQFVIRFQNTGTDTAFTVVVRDTLDMNFDIFSVQPGVSSHNYAFRMYGPRVLEWTFSNVMLPDSTTNEENSHGFLTFMVGQQSNLPDGTSLMNDADIYFDFNEPVITNNTVHTINSCIKQCFEFSGLKMEKMPSFINIFPNPASDILFVESKISQSAGFEVFNTVGKKCLSGEIFNSKNEIDISNLSEGVYLLKIDGRNYKFIKM